MKLEATLTCQSYCKSKQKADTVQNFEDFRNSTSPKLLKSLYEPVRHDPGTPLFRFSSKPS